MNIAVYSCLTTDRRESKRHKIMAHELFPHADWWLWCDWNIRPKIDPADLVALCTGDVAGFRHPHHNCLYLEAAACARMEKDDRDTIRRQVDRYRLERVPEHLGLIECGFLLRRNTPRVRRFNETWWAEVCAGSSRDQISFPYAAWRTGIELTQWEGNVRNSALVEFRL